MRNKLIIFTTSTVFIFVLSSIIANYISTGQITKALADSLKDPDSAQFKDIEIYRYDGEIHACGLVNAKNSYGGYTGFELFFIAKRSVGENYGRPFMGKMAETLCKGEKDLERFRG